MEAHIIKAKLQQHFYHQGFNMSCTEFGVYNGWADVFLYQRNRYTHEFEVKVSKADFMSEINCIDHILNGDREGLDYQKLASSNKYGKHHRYMDRELVKQALSYNPTNQIYPNKFSFAIPLELLPKINSPKVLELIETAGYGLYTIDPEQSSWVCLERVIKPQFIHREIQEVVIHKFAQRCFVENYNNFISKIQ